MTSISNENPMGTDGFEFLEFDAPPIRKKLAAEFVSLGFSEVANIKAKMLHCIVKAKLILLLIVSQRVLLFVLLRLWRLGMCDGVSCARCSKSI